MHPLSNLSSRSDISPKIDHVGQPGKTEKTRRQGLLSKFLGKIKLGSLKYFDLRSRSTKTTTTPPKTAIQRRKVSHKPSKSSLSRTNGYLKGIVTAMKLGEKIKSGVKFNQKEEAEYIQGNFGLELRKLQNTPTVLEAEKAIARLIKDNKKIQQELIKTGQEINYVNTNFDKKRQDLLGSLKGLNTSLDPKSPNSTAYLLEEAKKESNQNSIQEFTELLSQKKKEIPIIQKNIIEFEKKANTAQLQLQSLIEKHKSLTEQLKANLKNCTEKLQQTGFSEAQIQASLLHQLIKQGEEHQIAKTKDKHYEYSSWQTPPIFPILIDTLLTTSRVSESKPENPIETLAKVMALQDIVGNKAVSELSLLKTLNEVFKVEVDKVKQTLSKTPPPVENEINELKNSLQQSYDICSKAVYEYNQTGSSKYIEKGEILTGKSNIEGNPHSFSGHIAYAQATMRVPMMIEVLQKGINDLEKGPNQINKALDEASHCIESWTKTILFSNGATDVSRKMQDNLAKKYFF